MFYTLQDPDPIQLSRQPLLFLTTSLLSVVIRLTLWKQKSCENLCREFFYHTLQKILLGRSRSSVDCLRFPIQSLLLFYTGCISMYFNRYKFRNLRIARAYIFISLNRLLVKVNNISNSSGIIAPVGYFNWFFSFCLLVCMGFVTSLARKLSTSEPRGGSSYIVSKHHCSNAFSVHASKGAERNYWHREKPELSGWGLRRPYAYLSRL